MRSVRALTFKVMNANFRGIGIAKLAAVTEEEFNEGSAAMIVIAGRK